MNVDKSIVMPSHFHSLNIAWVTPNLISRSCWKWYRDVTEWQGGYSITLCIFEEAEVCFCLVKQICSISYIIGYSEVTMLRYTEKVFAKVSWSECCCTLCVVIDISKNHWGHSDQLSISAAAVATVANNLKQDFPIYDIKLHRRRLRVIKMCTHTSVVVSKYQYLVLLTVTICRSHLIPFE